MSANLRIGGIEIGAVPRVVGAISSPLTVDRVASGFRPACDIAEFRVDLFGVDTPDWLLRARELEADGIPVLLTLRHRREGGHWFRSDEERELVYRQTLPYLSALDVEIRSSCFAELAAQAHAHGRTMIGSFHDFDGMPAKADLLATIDQGRAKGADIVKIAALAREEGDLAVLESLRAERRDVPLCLLGMGPHGAVSRVRLAQAGSCLTYGYVDEANAPGQVSSAELQAKLAEVIPAYRASGRGRAE